MSGFLSKMGTSTAHWKVTGQKCVTLSSFGSEVIALVVSGTEQMIWVREFLKSAGFPVDELTTMLVDNQSAVVSLTGLKSANPSQTHQAPNRMAEGKDSRSINQS